MLGFGGPGLGAKSDTEADLDEYHHQDDNQEEQNLRRELVEQMRMNGLIDFSAVHALLQNLQIHVSDYRSGHQSNRLLRLLPKPLRLRPLNLEVDPSCIFPIHTACPRAISWHFTVNHVGVSYYDMEV